jgi:Flp pilus assembly protein TadD
MIDADRVLRPLQDAGTAIDGLDTYDSPAALLDALRATWHAVERTLRLLLRADPGTPEDVRLSALSPELPLPDVVQSLRRRDLISMTVAGRVHELGQAVGRAESSGARPSDADLAHGVVYGLESEIRALGRREEPRPPAAAAQAVADDDVVEETSPAAATGLRFQLGRPGRRSLLAAGIAGAVLVAAVAAVLLLGGGSDLEQGVAAFRDGRDGMAEQHFRAALQRDDGNVTARLYLARILRRQDRIQEAGDQLRTAVRLAPRDPAVRRELGHLLLSLNRAPAAAEQYRTAVELDPDEPLNWVGLVHALQRAGDPAADEWLRRAPSSAQAMIRTARTQGLTP